MSDTSAESEQRAAERDDIPEQEKEEAGIESAYQRAVRHAMICLGKWPGSRED